MQAPLPWRWLALETMRTSTFSTKSDVWAYGVTFWEIFSIGDTPYPYHNFTEAFMDHLESGYRLPKPIQAPDEWYPMNKRHLRITLSYFLSFFQLQTDAEVLEKVSRR